MVASMSMKRRALTRAVLRIERLQTVLNLINNVAMRESTSEGLRLLKK